MARKYYTLIERLPAEDGETRDWTVQFGDYDRSVVVEEGQSMADRRGFTTPKGTKFKIICTDYTKEAIEFAVAKLNGYWDHRNEEQH